MKTRILLLFLCLFLIAAVPRFLSLEAHWGSDEALWLRRSAQFMSAVQQGEFSQTLIAYHPGVSTMWLAGLRTFFTKPGLTVENLARARWFIGVIVWAGIGVACLLLYQLFGKWIALVSFASLAFSPFFLAQTRRVHTDALATTFMLLTVLLFLIYCQNRQHLRYLIFSGIAFGVALISKSYAVILLLWIPLCFFCFRYQEKHVWRTHIAEGLCFLNCAAMTTLFIWPVFWTLPFGILSAYLFVTTYALAGRIKNNTLSLKSFSLSGGIAVLGVTCFRAGDTLAYIMDRVGWAVTTPHDVEHFFFGKVVNDPGVLFYPLVLSIKSTPLMVPLVLVGCIFLWKRRKHSEETMSEFKIALTLVLCVVLFTVCFSITDKKFARYLLPAFPILEILAAMGLVELLRFSVSHFQARMPSLKNALIGIAAFCFFLINILPVLALCPYYGTYYNLCWKVADIEKIITVNDPSGVYLAAEYLNQKPDAAEIRVHVSYLGSAYFQKYFKGRPYRTDPNAISDIDRLREIDYEVVFIRDSQIGWVPQSGIRGGALEQVITVNGLDLAWIYQVPSEVN
ncbi:MAG: glycosyltransferase family 39 protein [Candidatus Poribacteria bacterium]|nr:glycosyltransferase family 39 protein [Candidatus Poribacteria bacterium]